MMKQEELLQFLKQKVSLFEGFTDEKLIQLITGSHLTTFERNEAVIEFGEEGRFLGILIDGEAEASITDDTGQKHRLAMFKPGDFFGEISLMTGDKTIADVIGIKRCKALLIPQVLFSTILVTNPAAVKRLSHSLSTRLRNWAVDSETGQNIALTMLKTQDDPYGFKLKTETPQKILVINCGSSSLKYSLFDTADEKMNVHGVVENINSDSMRLKHTSLKGEKTRDLPRGDYQKAFEEMIHVLMSPDGGSILSPVEIGVIGHRVVHGGDLFHNAAIVDDAVLKQIEDLSELAPLHNPINAIGIKEAKRFFPRAVQVAVFDTSFHHTMPNYAFLYGLPYEYYKEKKIRKYGFHGMSHIYVSLKAAEYLKQPFNSLEIISCHLGNGASMCAIDHGRSVDTTMGFTPADGLIMGTRCGSIDPGAIIYLIQREGLTADDLNNLINKKSGLLGLSGMNNDMRVIEQAAMDGNHRALLAYKAFCYNIRKTIGAYVAAMHGLDAVIFTGGIGQGSAGVRSLACQRLDYMGIVLDEDKNRQASATSGVFDISADGSPVRILVIQTDEELMIARETLRTIGRSQIALLVQSQKDTPVPVEVSAHHVHLSQEHVEALFGQGYRLTPLSELSQPGQFACKETVNLVGPKGRVEKVRVLGPVRKYTQVEIAMTEQFKLGIYPPIRESGDIANTPGVTIESGDKSVTIDKGVICALRHIHMSPEDALKFGLRDKYKVRVRIEGERQLIFGDVLIRVHPDYKLAMHIDTDEANAANIKPGTIGYVDGVQSRE